MSLDAFSWNLLLASAGIALTHTLLGPDHYLPFLMLARARGWSRARTGTITAICGVGHVASSILLGLVGILMGMAVARVEAIESARGDLAAWTLIAFGLAYGLWGVRRALRRGRGLDPHAHGDHVHLHAHGGAHHHHHDRRDAGSATTFWTLFAVFVLGPCEPLIPIFVLPASRGRWDLAILAAAVFGVLTIACMVALVLAGLAGLERLPLGAMERWSHALAGGVIAASGLAVVALGL